jgi:predicted dinucleotide-binding enzyme
MKIAVLGTGMVGESIATKLAALGHEVCMGARSATNEKAADWVARQPKGASQGTFAEAARHAEIVFICTRGDVTLDALNLAGRDNLAGKVLVDIANPLDFSKGMPPTLFVSNDDSLGERIQRAFPDAQVVKTLNIVNADVMVNPGQVSGELSMFLCGNVAEAKAKIRQLLESFGWKDVLDLGDISAARGMESVLPIWLRLWQALGTASFGFKVVR